ESVPELTSEERDIYESLRDQYSMLQRENADLKEQVQNFKTQLAQIDEERDEEPWMPDLSALNTDDDEESGEALPLELPSALPLELPGGLPEVNHAPRNVESAFDVDSDVLSGLEDSEDSDDSPYFDVPGDDEVT